MEVENPTKICRLVFLQAAVPACRRQFSSRRFFADQNDVDDVSELLPADQNGNLPEERYICARRFPAGLSGVPLRTATGT